jgi:SAM-dependent methyltransferase
MTDVQPGTAEYWDARYSTIGSQNVSWYQEEPAISLALISAVAPTGSSVVDVGGGASHLVEALLDAGYRDLTVVDLSAEALRASHERVGAAPVTWVASDIREWQPARAFDVWHDRAAYHFLTDLDDQDHYWQLVRETVPIGGHVVIGTFAEDGPESCSGLPVTRYSSAMLHAAMGDGFAVVETRPEVHRTPSGATQSFTWLAAERV